MKILYHHRTLGDGAEGIHIAEMVNAFRNLGHEVKVFSLIGSETNIESDQTRFWQKIKDLLPGFSYEISQLFFNIIEFIRFDNTVKNFNPDFIYKRHANFDVAPVLVAKKRNIPIILEVNGLYSYGGLVNLEPLKFSLLSRKYETWISSNVDKVIVVSTLLKRDLVSIGIPQKKIFIMPNGTNPDKFRPLNGYLIRKNYNLDGKTIIGFVGSLREWHGLEFLLEVFSEIQNQTDNLLLLIIGDGPIRESLEKYVNENSLKNNVFFMGRVSHDKMAPYIAMMNMTILPAERRAHASPMKILEYMAMERPTIAPNMINIKDIITDGEDGILFDPENKQGLKLKILDLLHNEELRKKIGKKARKKVINEFNWVNNAKKIIQIYNQLIKTRRYC